MPLTADPYELEDAPDRGVGAPDAAEGESNETNTHEGNELWPV